MPRLALIFLAGALQAASPNPDEQRAAEAFAARSVGSKIVTDDAGHVVKLAISRHAAKDASMPAGVGDDYDWGGSVTTHG